MCHLLPHDPILEVILFSFVKNNLFWQKMISYDMKDLNGRNIGQEVKVPTK